MPTSANVTLYSLESELIADLKCARDAYREMDKQVKPSCDFILDGLFLVDELAQKIASAVKARS